MARITNADKVEILTDLEITQGNASLLISRNTFVNTLTIRIELKQKPDENGEQETVKGYIEFGPNDKTLDALRNITGFNDLRYAYDTKAAVNEGMTLVGDSRW